MENLDLDVLVHVVHHTCSVFMFYFMGILCGLTTAKGKFTVFTLSSFGLWYFYDETIILVPGYWLLCYKLKLNWMI